MFLTLIYKFILTIIKNHLNQKKIIFYCAVGERSALAIQICQSYKFKQINHLIGGINNI